MTDRPPRPRHRRPATPWLAAAALAAALATGAALALLAADHPADTTWRVPDPSPYTSPPILRGTTSGGTR